MDNFLTKLYYERFQLTEKERKLMNNRDWNVVNGNVQDIRFYAKALTQEDVTELYKTRQEIDNVRNDQSITEVRQQLQMIDRLIESYIEKIKLE